MAPTNVQIDVHLAQPGHDRAMAHDVLEGLGGTPKRLPSKYFYDERGSALFERITQLPEYYLTRAEQALLDASAATIADVTAFEELVEFGSGSARKTRTLIDAGLAAGTLRRFLPFDVSAETAERAARAMASAYPGLDVHAVVADFEADFDKVPPGARRLVALLGSTIGNFVEDDAVRLLGQFATLAAGPGSWLLLGTDLVKDRAVLEAAYNDAAGVTAEFNANILHVINRGLDGDLDPARFEHVAFYNAEAARIESYLRARERHAAHLAAIDLDVRFEAGETIRTEVSCKYTRASVERLLERAGFELRHWFTDVGGTFALSLASVGASRRS